MALIRDFLSKKLVPVYLDSATKRLRQRCSSVLWRSLFPTKVALECIQFLSNHEAEGLREMKRNTCDTAVDMGYVGMSAIAIHSLRLICNAERGNMFLDGFRIVNKSSEAQPNVATLIQVHNPDPVIRCH